MKAPKNLQTPSSPTVLFLNRACVPPNDRFYTEIFRVPEILSCLRQYRDVLNDNEIDIPVWLYCLSQTFKTNLSSRPSPSIMGFIISLGLFDRWTERHGTPQYILGSGPVMSVICGEISFEEQALLLSRGQFQNSTSLSLYEARSPYRIGGRREFCLLGLKKRQESKSLKEILLSLRQKIENKGLDGTFQFLTPHEEEFMDRLQAMGIFPEDFLEEDAGLNWLWPTWKRSQIHQRLKPGSAKIG